MLCLKQFCSTHPLSWRSVNIETREIRHHGSITNCFLNLHPVAPFIKSPCIFVCLCPQTFLENSHPAIQSLESLQTRAMEEFSKVASYFGEDSKSSSTETFFGIFSEFVSKFEVSYYSTVLCQGVDR